MRRRLPFLPVLLVAGSLAGGCIDDIRVCEIVPAENTCEHDDDCVLGYCATDCCYCPNAIAERQLEATWCLTRQGETPFTDCLRGRPDRCAGHPPCVCVYDVEPWCNDGICDLRPAP
jgi:hypothetical protein